MVDFVVTMAKETAQTPVIVSVVLAAILRFGFGASRPTGGLCIAAGFFAGWATQQWGTLSPKRYLDWTPWFVMVLGVWGCVSHGIRRRILTQSVTVFLIVVATWFLLPDFRDMSPRRTVSVGLIGSLAAIVSLLLARMEDRLPSRLMSIVLLITGGTCSLVLAQSFGLKFSQICGMLTAGLAGQIAFAVRGAATGVPVVFIPALSCVMFMGYASSSSNVPVFAYFLPIMAPLFVGVAMGHSGADQHETSRNRLLCSLMLIGAVLLTAAIPAVLAHPPWEDEGLAELTRFTRQTTVA